MNDIECPYCDHGFDICHDDGFGYSESEAHKQKCPSCKKYFLFNTSISFYYEPEKADCLNGAPHNYQMTRTIPKEFAREECNVCGHRKDKQ